MIWYYITCCIRDLLALWSTRKSSWFNIRYYCASIALSTTTEWNSSYLWPLYRPMANQKSIQEKLIELSWAPKSIRKVEPPASLHGAMMGKRTSNQPSHWTLKRWRYDQTLASSSVWVTVVSQVVPFPLWARVRPCHLHIRLSERFLENCLNIGETR